MIPCQADNPIIKKPFTADPTALVHNGTLYLYIGHNETVEKVHDYVMRDWLCFSTTDMAAWKPEGSPLPVTEFKWAKADAWACDVKERDEKFYFYARWNTRAFPAKPLVPLSRIVPPGLSKMRGLGIDHQWYDH